MLRSPLSVLIALGKVALATYMLLGLAFLGVRYLVLPDINRWSQPIASQISAAVGTHVQFDTIHAQWFGLNPTFQVSNVRLLDSAQRRVLAIPQVKAELSWRSLFALSPRFLSLQIDNVQLDVRRDHKGRIHALGQSFDPAEPAPADSGDTGFIRWLLLQQRIILRDARIRWTSEDGDQPAFELSNVTLDMLNSKGVHRLSLLATPPTDAGKALDARLELRGVNLGHGTFSLKGSQGRAYIDVQELRPRGWSIFMPDALHPPAGRFSLAAWADLDDGLPAKVTTRIRAEGVRWTPAEAAEVRFQALDAFVSGSWGDLYAWMDDSEQTQALQRPDSSLSYQVGLSGLRVNWPQALRMPVDIDRLDVQGFVQRSQQGMLQVTADSLSLANDDVQATFSGRWNQAPDTQAGFTDVQGRVHMLRIAAIRNYLPLTVDPDAVQWMQTGLLDGQIVDAGLRLQGDLAYFPFQEQPAKGDFIISGRHQNTVIDYVPTDEEGPGWPKLQGMRGQVSLHRADLRLTADTAYIDSAPGQRIELLDVQARIPDIENKAVLWVDGSTRAPAPAYLALMNNSPLGDLLDHAVSQAIGEGLWEVPLRLVVPLYDSINSQVAGRIRFADSQLELMPGVPRLQALNGELEFTETYLKAVNLQAQALGGNVTIQGGLGQGFDGMVFSGQASATALKDYMGMAQLKRMSGSVDYSVSLRRAANGYVISGSSSLKGLALDLPAPLGKAAAQTLALNATWEPVSAQLRRLKVTMGPSVAMTFMRREGGKGSYFYAGSVGVNQAPKLPSSGLVIDVDLPAIDLDAWNLLADELAQGGGSGGGLDDEVLPAVSQIRLQAVDATMLGLLFEHFTLAAQRTPALQWRIDISSSETAGTVFWQQAKGSVAGNIEAKFDRLALGQSGPGKGAASASSNDSAAGTLDVNERFDLPAVNLYAKNFSLYGQPVGELTVTGRNQARRSLWRLQELKLVSPGATFNGSGLWRLSGPDRGLSLQLNADVRDMGAYLSQVGHKEVMAGGAGKLSADLEWRNMPWAFSRTDLNGKLKFDLTKGRFSSVNSQTARLLELLSLQSVRRLARLELNPAELTREGFPFDNLGGELTLTKGVMTTRDYRVTGPVATIVLEGDVNLVSERLNLDAVVVPNLDVSGAAVAAGIAINPIVGIGAFLTQWLLQAPLSKAMSVQYHIEGPWVDPAIREVLVSQPKGSLPGAGSTAK